MGPLRPEPFFELSGKELQPTSLGKAENRTQRRVRIALGRGQGPRRCAFGSRYPSARRRPTFTEQPTKPGILAYA